MKTEIISGNFNVAIEGSGIKADKQDEVNVDGITSIAYREGLSSVYKELLPKDAKKRNELEFSDEASAQFAAALSKVLAPYVDGLAVDVTKHVPSEGAASPMVRATAFVDSLMDDGDKETQLRATLALFDPTAAEADRDGLVAIAHKQGLGIQPPKAPKGANGK